jgi:hypothetical protein
MCEWAFGPIWPAIRQSPALDKALFTLGKYRIAALAHGGILAKL